MNDKCECGIYKERDGFSRIYPSDCHERGGHYVDYFDRDGEFVSSSAPWQVFPGGNLSDKEMAVAQ